MDLFKELFINNLKINFINRFYHKKKYKNYSKKLIKIINLEQRFFK